MQTTTPANNNLREAWLNRAVTALRGEFFDPRALTFKTPLRISVGWCRGSNKAIGQCWNEDTSGDGTTEIFISPVLADPIEVLATTLHELIHAHLGTGKGHGKPFKALKETFGLAGKCTATFAENGSKLHASLEAISAALGAYPHAKLQPTLALRKAPDGDEPKGGWPRFKSKRADDYRIMVSPKSLRLHGIPKDPWGEECIPTKEQE